MADNDDKQGLLSNPTNKHRLYQNETNKNNPEESLLTVKTNGLTVPLCAIFIVAEIAGSGILALPKAVSEAGWSGVGLLLLCCFLSLYCGIILGKCLIIARSSEDEDDEHIRDPYPMIGLAASGKTGKYVVEFCIFLTLFGACVVYLLLASDQISDLLDTNIGSFTPKSEYRIWVLICGGFLLPCTWLATPKEIWPFGLAAALCTILSCFFMVARTGMVINNYGVVPASKHKDVTAKSFFSAFGTIAFSYGGAAMLPSFQTDMKQPSLFTKAAIIGFLCILCLYLPVSILPFLAFGTDIQDNILKSLKSARGSGEGIVRAAEALITLHLLFAFIIIINPIAQQIEEYLNAPHKFGWKRIAIRTCLMLLIIGVAELLPNFGPILSLIGGSTVTMLAFILPCWFYLKLQEDVSIIIKVLHAAIIIFAIVCGVAATYSAGTSFTNPFKQ